MSSVSSSRPIPDKLDRLYLPIVIIFPITSGLPSQPCKNTCQLLEKKAHVTSVATDFFKTAAELIPIVQPYHTVPLDTREPPKQPSTPSDDSEFDHWATEQSSLSRKSPSLLHWESPPASLAASSIFASEQKLDFSPPQHPVDGDTHDTNLNGSVFTVLSAEPLLQSESFRTVDIITDTVGLTSATSLPSNFVYTNPTTMASNMKLDEGFDDMLIALPPSDDLPVIYSGTKSARPTSYQKFSRRRSFCCRNLRETICHQYILLSAFVALLTVIITSVVTWKLTASNYAIPYEEAKSVLVDLSVFFLEPNLSGSTRSTRSDKPDSNPLEPAEDGRRNVCRLGSDQCRTALQARLLTPSNCRRPWQTEKWKLESMLAQQLNKSDLCGFYQCKEIRICCHEAATAENNLAKVIFKVELSMNKYQLERTVKDSGKMGLQMAFMAASATLSEMYEKAIYNSRVKRVTKTEVCVHQLNFIGTKFTNACLPQSVCVQEFSPSPNN